MPPAKNLAPQTGSLDRSRESKIGGMLDAIVNGSLGCHGDDLAVDQLGARRLALGIGPGEVLIDRHGAAKGDVHETSVARLDEGAKQSWRGPPMTVVLLRERRR
jgi:hypothetical protein